MVVMPPYPDGLVFQRPILTKPKIDNGELIASKLQGCESLWIIAEHKTRCRHCYNHDSPPLLAICHQTIP